jgi:hypothetical protein
MPFSIYTLKLVALAETLHRWMAVLMGLDRANRERIAEYSEAIAATLARAAQALIKLDTDPAAPQARAEALRELGRITGYVETMVAVLEQHLDGRKIAGVKRRLDALDIEQLATWVAERPPDAKGVPRAERLATAEGYFRALADGLRA